MSLETSYYQSLPLKLRFILIFIISMQTIAVHTMAKRITIDKITVFNI